MPVPFSQFSRLKSPSSLRKLAEWDQEKVELDSIDCPVHALHKRAGKRLTELTIVLPRNKDEDFVWTWQSECLIQDRTLKLLRTCGFTGFDVKPVVARYSKSTEKPPKLWELVITGWAGMANPVSGIQINKTESCLHCKMLRYAGLLRPEYLIDQSKWDGSDFFMVWPLPRFKFVTNKVVEFIREHRLTGVQIERISEIKTRGSGFGPGRLSYWMPERRAHELGDPLGIY